MLQLATTFHIENLLPNKLILLDRFVLFYSIVVCLMVVIQKKITRSQKRTWFNEKNKDHFL